MLLRQKLLTVFSCEIVSVWLWNFKYTAIPYRASTGPEQGVLFLTGKTCFHYRDFPVRKSTQGNPVFITGNGFAVFGFLSAFTIEIFDSSNIQTTLWLKNFRLTLKELNGHF